MADTSGRLLTLLSLLQTPREWPGPELARRLSVSTRTVRNDVERLRALGYPVRASRGSVGGYQLAAGTAMPPLLLDDEEAVAVAVSLRTAAGGAVAGAEETCLRALTKLQQVLPHRLAGRVDALHSYTVRVAPRRRMAVDGTALALIAAAARDREVLRFAYSDHSGTASERRVEPYRLVSLGQRWYLVAFDVERDDWRMFRIDRVADPRSVQHRFTPRPLPADDLAGWVAGKTRLARERFRATVEFDAPAEDIVRRLGSWGAGTVEPVGARRCRMEIGAQSAAELATWLGFLDVDFRVVDSVELAQATLALAERLARAAG